MAKSKPSSQRKRKKKKSTNWRQIFIVGFMMIAIIAFIFSSLPPGLFTGGSSSSSASSSTARPENSEPAFTKEGELTINKANGELIKKINIEIAETENERNLGLMYRRSLPKDSGMLFVFDKNAPRSFWMKNTYIPLDIVYIDDQKKIVDIAKNSLPRSEGSIPSKENAQYVLEMIGGYCEAYGIEVGDVVNW